jgi:putative transposase
MKPQRVHNFGSYFVTTQTWGRRSLFQVDELARLFIETLYNYRSKGNYLLHDFVIMPNHVHLIVTPTGVTLEGTMQLIKGGYSHSLRVNGRPTLEVWQPGYTDHRIRDEEGWGRHVEYIHSNPVRAHLCGSPEEFRYSAACGSYELDPIPQRLKPVAVEGERRRG